jgi:hypothetical protein
MPSITSHAFIAISAACANIKNNTAVCEPVNACGGAGLEFLIGYTRLGNLLALLDREEVPEIQKHLVW